MTTITSATADDDKFGAYKLLGPSADLQPYVSNISTYETSLSLVVAVTFDLPNRVVDVLRPGLAAFAAEQGCDIHENSSGRFNTIGVGDPDAVTHGLRLSFEFDDEHDTVRILPAFYDYLRVLLRLENASGDGALSTAQAAQLLSMSLGSSSIMSRALAGRPKTYEHTWKGRK